MKFTCPYCAYEAPNSRLIMQHTCMRHGEDASLRMINEDQVDAARMDFARLDAAQLKYECDDCGDSFDIDGFDWHRCAPARRVDMILGKIWKAAQHG